MGDNYYYANQNPLCPSWASLFGFSGCVIAVVFASESLTWIMENFILAVLIEGMYRCVVNVLFKYRGEIPWYK